MLEKLLGWNDDHAAASEALGMLLMSAQLARLPHACS
jgi:hypothetical protein